MKKQPGCERLHMRTPLGAVPVLVPPSPPREFQAAVEKMLVEEAAPRRSWTGRISLLSNLSKILEKVVGEIVLPLI